MRLTTFRFTTGLAAVMILGATVSADFQRPTSHKFTIVARDCRFTPARFEVNQYDGIAITFIAEDAPHSFQIDAYRIAKRAAPGQNSSFEFLADRKGAFVYYSDLLADQTCENMRGELIVH